MDKRQENGHTFDFNTEKCNTCGMSLEYYEDNGKPVCKNTQRSNA